MGPFELMDATTSRLVLQASEILHEAYGERFRPPALLKQRVRAGVSEEIIAKIEETAKTIGGEAVVKERMASVIADPVVSDRKTFGAFIQAERQKWGPLIQRLGLRVD